MSPPPGELNSLIDAKFLLLQLLNSGDWQAVIEAYRLIYHTGKLVADVNNEIELLAKEWQILLAYKPFFSRSARGIIR